MPAQGDVYQLTITGNYLGQLIQNVFNYRIEDTPTSGAAEGLATQFVTDCLDDIRALQSTAVTWTSIKTVNLFDHADLFEDALSLGGTVSCGGAGSETPSFVAIYFKLIRDNARVDNGAKYIGGICEGNVQQNTVVGLDAALTNAEAAIKNDLLAGATDNFAPVLVKRVRVTATKFNRFDEQISYYKYSLPTSQEQMGNMWAYIRDVQASLNVSHMVSRQKGRGA